MADSVNPLTESLHRLGVAFARLRGEQDQQAESSGRTANALRGFKNDIVFSERMVSAFSRTLMHMGAGMNEVTRGFLGISVALAGGFGAVELIIAAFRLIQAFTGILEHQREVASHLREVHHNLTMEIVNGFTQMERGFKGQVSPVWEFWFKEVDKVRDSYAKLMQEDARLRENLEHGATKAGLVIRKTFEDLEGAIIPFMSGTQVNQWLVGQEHLWDVGGMQRREEIQKELATSTQVLREQDYLRAIMYAKYKTKVELESSFDIAVARAQLADKTVQIQAELDRKLEKLRLEAYAKDEKGREIGKGKLWYDAEAKSASDIANTQISRTWKEREIREGIERRRIAAIGMSEEYQLNRARLDAIDALQIEYLGRTDRRSQEALGRAIQRANDEFVRTKAIKQKERDEKALDEQAKSRAERDQQQVQDALTVWQHRYDTESALEEMSTAKKLRQVDQEAKREKEIEDARMRVGAIDREEYNRRLARIDELAGEQRAKIQAEWAKPGIDYVVRSWETALDQMLAGTYRWGDMMKNIWLTVVGFLGGIIKSMVSKWVEGELTKLIATASVKVKELVLHTTTEEAKTAVTTAEVAKRIPAQAGEAAVAAGASAATMPGIGWMIAIPVAAAVFGALIGYLAHAAGGWDVPKGGPFPTMLHGEEMVLPAYLANTVRSMSNDSGGGGATANITIHALDSQSFYHYLRDPTNRDSVLSLISEAWLRNRRI